MLSKVKNKYQLALEVINGEWGNGDERKEKLTSAGYNYDEVQTLVNEILEYEGGIDGTITVEVDLNTTKRVVFNFK